MIEGLGGQLGLNRKQVEPSFNSLYWCAEPPVHGPLPALSVPQGDWVMVSHDPARAVQISDAGPVEQCACSHAHQTQYSACSSPGAPLSRPWGFVPHA